MPRAPKKTAKSTSVSPLADRTVSAVVTVICAPDGGADVHVKVDVDGLGWLAWASNPATRNLKIIGGTLRRVVLPTLGAEQGGPTVDVLAQRRSAGRA